MSKKTHGSLFSITVVRQFRFGIFTLLYTCEYRDQNVKRSKIQESKKNGTIDGGGSSMKQEENREDDRTTSAKINLTKLRESQTRRRLEKIERVLRNRCLCRTRGFGSAMFFSEIQRQRRDASDFNEIVVKLSTHYVKRRLWL
jgi:hypothetical protein